jgi:hypothetical protein
MRQEGEDRDGEGRSVVVQRLERWGPGPEDRVEPGRRADAEAGDVNRDPKADTGIEGTVAARHDGVPVEGGVSSLGNPSIGVEQDLPGEPVLLEEPVARDSTRLEFQEDRPRDQGADA